MTPDNQDFDELDRLMCLALQKTGKIISSNLDDDLEDEFKDIELPESLLDVDSAVDAIINGGKLFNKAKILPFQASASASVGNTEYALAARNGAKLSSETLKQLDKLKGETD